MGFEPTLFRTTGFQNERPKRGAITTRPLPNRELVFLFRRFDRRDDSRLLQAKQNIIIMEYILHLDLTRLSA